MYLTIVIPARNEGCNIVPLLEEIRLAMTHTNLGRTNREQSNYPCEILDNTEFKNPQSALPIDYEIIVINDDSHDDTLQKLTAYKKNLGERLIILSSFSNIGQSTAIYHGVQRAQGRWIVILDGDGQNNPNDIPRLLAQGESFTEADVLVMGNRASRRDNWWRIFCSRVANGIRAFLLKDNTSDTGCGLKALKRETFLKIPYFDHMHRFMPALVLRLGGKVVSVDVDHRPREQGQSNYKTLNRTLAGVVDLIGVYWLIHRSRTQINIIENRK